MKLAEDSDDDGDGADESRKDERRAGQLTRGSQVFLTKST